jgi:hypothetical protein
MRGIVRWWYTRRIDREIHEKETLKTRLDEKLEELKEKSDYYNTQQLLERYDSKSPSNVNLEKPREQFTPQQQPIQHHLQHKPSTDNLRQQQSLDQLRQRGNSRPPIPPLPPPITSSVFSPPLPQNIPQFHPSAFSPPPSPSLTQEQHAKTFLDRVLDLLVGEDENAADHRYALICRHCRAHNGLAPPGERGEDVGYLCGRCGGWNGPEPNKKGQNSSTQSKDDKSDQGLEEIVAKSVEKSRNNGAETQEVKGESGEKPQE